jgi:DNA invertase Pin-like site-specific DNA recombinase
MDAITPHGRAMLQMAAVFGELERGMIRERVLAGLQRARAKGVRLGRQPVSAKIERQIRAQLEAGVGKVKIGRVLGCGTGPVQRIAREMSSQGHDTRLRAGRAHRVAGPLLVTHRHFPALERAWPSASTAPGTAAS